MNGLILCLIKERLFSKFYQQLAVANNRIITLQEEMERVKEESSYILESNRKGPKPDRTSEGQALSEARKHLKEETQLRLVNCFCPHGPATC